MKNPKDDELISVSDVMAQHPLVCLSKDKCPEGFPGSVVEWCQQCRKEVLISTSGREILKKGRASGILCDICGNVENKKPVMHPEGVIELLRAGKVGMAQAAAESLKEYTKEVRKAAGAPENPEIT